MVVTWHNTTATTTHSVTSGADFSDTGLNYWPSHDLSPGTDFMRTFKAAGTFIYHCRFHSSMVGKIKVVS